MPNYSAWQAERSCVDICPVIGHLLWPSLELIKADCIKTENYESLEINLLKNRRRDTLPSYSHSRKYSDITFNS